MNKKSTLISSYIFIVLFFSSCYDSYDICDKSKTVILKSGFYQQISGVETPSTVSSFSLSLLNGASLYDKQPEVSKFTTTLNPETSSITYIIKVAEILPEDTLTISYTTKPETISPECGIVNAYDITNITSSTHSIDSIKLASPVVNTTGAENLKIYY